MAPLSDDDYQGEGKTIEDAAEDAAKKVPTQIKNETFELTIYAQLSGEHNPIHGYIVVLNPPGS
jgi:hypothetical protein